MPVRLSYSAATRYRQCPQKYFLSKAYETKTRSSAFAFGTAVEEAVTYLIQYGDLEEAYLVFEHNWTVEKNGYKVLGNLDIEFYKSDFDARLVNLENSRANQALKESGLNFENWEEAFDALNGKEATEPERLFIHKINWISCLVRGNLMVKAFHDQILPNIESVVEIEGKPGIQFKVSFSNEDGSELVGYVDYVLKMKDKPYPVIIDFKTSSAPYDDHQLETSEQLRTYTAYLSDAIGHCLAGYFVLLKKIKFEKICESCEEIYDYRFRKCRECGESLINSPKADHQVLITEFSEELVEDVFDDYQNILESVQQNLNYKNSASCMNYGRKCEFYDVCWKNRNPDELDHLIRKEKNNV